MPGLEIHREENSGRVLLRLEGTLDSRTALLLRRSLEELHSREVEVDFTHLREFRDTAVGVLTHSLQARQVHMRGIAAHQARMFRYFGFHTELPPRAWYPLEERLSA